MRKYLLPKDGKFFKANLHCHSTCSDGALSPLELKKAYKDQGYSILAITDHEYLFEHSYLDDEEFLTITGYELSINEDKQGDFKFVKTCHLNLFAREQKNTTHICFHPWYMWCGDKSLIPLLKYKGEYYVRKYTPECINDIIKTANENGFLVSYNHPHWSLENLYDYGQYEGMFAMEIYNHCSDRIAGINTYSIQAYDDMLRLGKRIYCLAVDDNHSPHPYGHPYCDMFGGFTMIKAKELRYDLIIKALEKGDFYASLGPEIYSLYIEDNKVIIECEPAKHIYMSTAFRRAIHKSSDQLITKAEFDLAMDDGYIRFDVVDEKGRRANTRAYFLDELF